MVTGRKGSFCKYKVGCICQENYCDECTIYYDETFKCYICHERFRRLDMGIINGKNASACKKCCGIAE